MELTPDLAFLTNPQVTLPINIDPVVNLVTTFDTFVQTNYTTPQSTLGELRSGMYGTNYPIARSLLKFDTLSLAGMHIQRSTLYLWENRSKSCAPSQVQVRAAAGPFDDNTVWTSQPTGGGLGGTADSAHGYSPDCPAAWTGIPSTNLVQDWADGAANHGLLVRATNEANINSGKHFNSANGGTARPKLTVDYTHPGAPDTPTSMLPADGETIPTEFPVLRGTYCDVDNDPGWIEYELTDTDGNRMLARGTTVTACGGASEWSALAHEQEFLGAATLRARGFDGNAYSSWTATRTFTVDPAAVLIPDDVEPVAPEDVLSDEPHSEGASAQVYCPNWIVTGIKGAKIFQIYKDSRDQCIPMRMGSASAGWGKNHIDDRCSSARNHCWGRVAEYRTIMAVSAPSLICQLRPRVWRHYWNFFDGKKRNQQVVLDWNGYYGLGSTGVRTSYYETGRYRTSC